MGNVHSVGIIGAGFISLYHLEALTRIPDIKIVAVCDGNVEKAQALASKWKIPHVFSTVEELIAAKICETAHVLVPPDYHFAVAEKLLRAGINVMVEKPLAVTAADCETLVAIAKEKGVKVGVNHNSTFRPSILQLKEVLNSGEIGKLHHLIVHFNLPLRQLGAKQFSHWMFQLPQNMFLESGVHPLSQVYDLAGKIKDAQTLVSGKHSLSPGVEIYDTWQISMNCERATAQLFLSMGQDFPSNELIAICSDGTVTADIIHERCTVQTRTKEMDFYNTYLTGVKKAKSMAGQSIKSAIGYVGSQLKVMPKNDPFMLSINESVKTFYAGMQTGKPYVDGEAGLEVLRGTELITKDVAKPSSAMSKAPVNSLEKIDAVVIGGTGFIGTPLVTQMIDAGMKVRVVARNIRTLPDIFFHENVQLVSANMADEKAVEKVIEGASIVLHLAHGGGGDTWQEVKSVMVDGTAAIAQACLKNNVKRLIYIGTIASLYLGNSSEKITGKTPNDPQTEKRNLYSRGKAACEDVLNKLFREKGLPVVILRPGVVIGDGGQAMHSGLGFFNQDAHMIGWNRGSNPLPFVLVDECADAIFKSISAENVEGKSYNIIGDVRLTAQEYMQELAKETGRPFKFHPQSVSKLQLIEIGKWLIKISTGRKDAPFPSYNDLKSRGLAAQFETSDIKNDLKWQVSTDRQAFIRKGLAAHRKQKND
jgi:predicted dehydrogenase/nucleoside-diphosphate-sugar epimerase